MTCTRPIETYLPRDGGAILFREPVGADPRDFVLFNKPCGKCPSCLEARARDWAVRCMHEAKMHERNSFVTLTYRDDALPWHGSLDKSQAQHFLMRLRKALYPHRIRYFLVGEYGSRTYRAHYHALIFGEDFTADRLSAGQTQSGFRQYESVTLSDAWGLGRCTVQDLTMETAMYCCRYALKASTPADGKRGRHWWRHPHGQWLKREREFQLMSRRPGLGHAWFERFHADLTTLDAVVMPGGQEFMPPRYYDKILRAWCEDDFQATKAKRLAEAQTLANLRDSTPARLAVREAVQKAKHALSARDTF